MEGAPDGGLSRDSKEPRATRTGNGRRCRQHIADRGARSAAQVSGSSAPAYRYGAATLNPESTPWVRASPARDASLRIVCLPFAGGGASIFRPWWSMKDIQICAVELPGRESRFAERPFRDLSALARELATALGPFFDCPYALFGHSLGGLLSFELARELRRRAMPAPIRLFASACRAPQLPNRRKPISGLDDPLFLEQVARFRELPDEVIDPEVIKLVLPTLRADYEMYESYVYAAEPPFSFPVTALGGSRDDLVTAGDLVAWSFQTTGQFRLRVLPGGHLFLRTTPERVIQTVLAEMGS
jgi:medium-chain acyl-[acyl-carrier-protein] hydrolase